jgi:hypothetical protein
MRDDMPADAVLLIDLENMIGSKARANMLERKLDALLEYAGPAVPAVASCAGSAVTDAGAKILASRHVSLHKVSGAKDAADKKLCAEATIRARQGCRRFLVASYDSGFGQIADLGSLEIIIWDTGNPKLAQKYSDRAAQIHRIPKPTASTPAATAQSPGPVPAQLGTPPGDTCAPPAARPFSQSGLRPDLVPLATAGIGVIAGGILFGAGTAFGAAVALRVLRASGLNGRTPS